MKSDESRRRRPILIIVFTICVGLCLGYIYSYSRSNRVLMNKHATLTFSYKTCTALFEKCDGKLNRCTSTAEELKESKRHLLTSVETHKNGLTSVQNNLQAANDKYSKAYQLYLDVAVITGVSGAADGASGANALPAMKPETINAVKEEIIKLKKNKADHEELKVKYAALEDNHKKLKSINDAITSRVNKLEDTKNNNQKQQQGGVNLNRQNSLPADNVEAKQSKNTQDEQTEDLNTLNSLPDNSDAKMSQIRKEKQAEDMMNRQNLQENGDMKLQPKNTRGKQLEKQSLTEGRQAKPTKNNNRPEIVNSYIVGNEDKSKNEIDLNSIPKGGKAVRKSNENKPEAGLPVLRKSAKQEQPEESDKRGKINTTGAANNRNANVDKRDKFKAVNTNMNDNILKGLAK